MKKIVKFSLLIILVLMVGCGKSYAGTYVQEYSKYVGDPDSAKNTNEVAKIILNNGGTGQSIRNGTNYNIEWSIDGENITIAEITTNGKVYYNGTLVNGKLDLFDGDKANALTNESVYNKE